MNIALTPYPYWHLEQVESTQDALLNRLQAGEVTHGASVLAERQTAGRGRQGRSWQSFEGNYMASIWLDTSVLPLARRIYLSYLTGVVLHEVILPTLPSSASLQLKWPNDLLLNGEKLAGVLIEAAGEGHAVGIGVNLLASPEDAELRYPAIALAHITDRAPTAQALHDLLLPALLDAFDRWCDGGDDWLLHRWQQLCQPVGTPLKVQLHDGTVCVGAMQGLSADGKLQLLNADGTLYEIAAGDVIPTLTDEGL